MQCCGLRLWSKNKTGLRRQNFGLGLVTFWFWSWSWPCLVDPVYVTLATLLAAGGLILILGMAPALYSLPAQVDGVNRACKSTIFHCSMQMNCWQTNTSGFYRHQIIRLVLAVSIHSDERC